MKEQWTTLPTNSWQQEGDYQWKKVVNELQTVMVLPMKSLTADCTSIKFDGILQNSYGTTGKIIWTPVTTFWTGIMRKVTSFWVELSPDKNPSLWDIEKISDYGKGTSNFLKKNSNFSSWQLGDHCPVICRDQFLKIIRKGCDNKHCTLQW
jgi:hypothetical protein